MIVYQSMQHRSYVLIFYDIQCDSFSYIYIRRTLSVLFFLLTVPVFSVKRACNASAKSHHLALRLIRIKKQVRWLNAFLPKVMIMYDSISQESVVLDPGFSIISLFRKFSKSGFNHLSDCISFHCSPIVPYLKQFLIHCNHPVQSSSLSTFL